MILYVACFCVNFCAFSPSMCLDAIKLGLGSRVTTFWERAAHSAKRSFSALYHVHL